VDAIAIHANVTPVKVVDVTQVVDVHQKNVAAAIKLNVYAMTVLVNHVDLIVNVQPKLVVVELSADAVKVHHALVVIVNAMVSVKETVNAQEEKYVNAVKTTYVNVIIVNA